MVDIDPVSQEVKNMYERYPYPPRPPGVVADLHPALMLSYIERKGEGGDDKSGSLHVLDAGCGTGQAALGTALANPNAQVVAVDFNRVALQHVEEEAGNLGLRNLKVLEVDLTTLEGLPVPKGGYDFIFCSGVLHHLPDPQQALELLAGILSPSGVLRLMVYGSYGRQGIYRFVEALKQLFPGNASWEERLLGARRLMSALGDEAAVKLYPWRDAADIPDEEFVDRYLHPREASYTVSSFFELIERAGLRFVRWYEPREWSWEWVLNDTELCEDLRATPELERYKAIELLVHRPRLDAILSLPGAKPRMLPGDCTELTGKKLALSPQVDLTYTERLCGKGVYYYDIKAVVRQGPPRALTLNEFGLIKAMGLSPCAVDDITFPLAPGEKLRLLYGLLRDEIVYLA